MTETTGAGNARSPWRWGRRGARMTRAERIRAARGRRKRRIVERFRRWPC